MKSMKRIVLGLALLVAVVLFLTVFWGGHVIKREDQSITQISTQVVRALFGVVVNAVAGAGDLLGDGLGAALEGLGSVGGMAVGGARAVTGAAGDGARAVTGAVEDGVRRLFRRGEDAA